MLSSDVVVYENSGTIFEINKSQEPNYKQKEQKFKHLD